MLAQDFWFDHPQRGNKAIKVACNLSSTENFAYST
jgi:hypothetical protein